MGDWAEAILDRLFPRGLAKDRLGRAGERAARRHLRRQGYRVLGRNLHVPMGEADVLCEAPDARTIVLVEVKTRAARPEPSLWTPERNVTAGKRRRLRAILTYLVRRNGWTDRPNRIDVIAVEVAPRGRVTALRHHEDVA